MRLSQKSQKYKINKNLPRLLADRRKGKLLESHRPREWRLEQAEVGKDIPSRWDQQDF